MEQTISSFIEITSKDFSTYPHGIAYLSSIDGRGNFIIFAIFKVHGSGRRGRRRMHNFTGLLCSCEGEFRDGFVYKFTENEILSLVQCYLETAHKRIPLVKLAACDVAAFIFKWCYEAAIKKNAQMEEYLTKEVLKAVKLFQHASKYTIYKNITEYFLERYDNPKKTPKFFFLDQRRREFQSWWIEHTEFQHCSLPLPPPFPYRFQGKHLTPSYLNKFNNKLYSEENYFRFSGMARHMGFWYLNYFKKSYLTLAATMFNTFHKMQENKKSGRLFDMKNPLFTLIVNKTQVMLNRQGQCEEQKPTRINLATRRTNCNICGAAVETRIADNDLTCVNKDGELGIGNEMTREVLTVLFHDVKKVGIPRDALPSVKRVFENAIYTFFTHCFKSYVYWRENPPPKVIEKIADKCTMKILSIITHKKTSQWRILLLKVLPNFLREIGGKMLSNDTINTVTLHFSKACHSIKEINSRHNSPQSPEVVKYSIDCKVQALSAYVNGPRIANHLKLRWKYISEERRKQLLDCDRELVNQVLLDVYKKTTLIVIDNLRCLKNEILKLNEKNDKVSSLEKEAPNVLTKQEIKNVTTKRETEHTTTKHETKNAPTKHETEHTTTKHETKNEMPKQDMKIPSKQKEETYKTNGPQAKQSITEDQNTLKKKKICTDSECPCHLFSRFKEYFLMVLPDLTEKKESLLRWAVPPFPDNDDTNEEDEEKTINEKEEQESSNIGGVIRLNYCYFLHNNTLLSEIVSGNEQAIAESIESCRDTLPNDCSLLHVMSIVAYFRILTETAVNVMQHFSDAPLLDDYCPISEDYYRPSCGWCKWEEDANDWLFVCGGCRGAYYCSKECQKRDWIRGHGKKCSRITRKNADKP